MLPRVLLVHERFAFQQGSTRASVATASQTRARPSTGERRFLRCNVLARSQPNARAGLQCVAARRNMSRCNVRVVQRKVRRVRRKQCVRRLPRCRQRRSQSRQVQRVRRRRRLRRLRRQVLILKSTLPV
jgi:hypothetical protein